MATLHEYGFSGFTQLRVAKRAQMRQSHLTYYYPTRLELLEAVARVAVDGQLAAVDAMLGLTSMDALAQAISSRVVRHENTRVLLALAQGADQEPSLRGLFCELADGVAVRFGRVFENLNVSANREQVAMIHALVVGLAVIDVATQRSNGRRRAEEIVGIMLATLCSRAETG